jgi:tRNA pseudouridine13 synthase
MTLRRFPEDFVVEERLSEDVAVRLRPTIDRAARFAVYRVTKTSLTTPQAAGMLARELGVPVARVSYAGLKDKHAVTTQHMAAEARVGGEASGKQGVECAGVRAELIGFSMEPARAAWIHDNAFRIVVRSLNDARAKRLGERADMFTESAGGPTLWLVNYFGEQRFASARHGEGFAARHLVRGEFEQAMRLLIGTPTRKDSGPRRALTRAVASHWSNFDSAIESIPRCPERRAVEVLAAGGSFAQAFAALPTLDKSMCIEAYQSMLWNRMARLLSEQVDRTSVVRVEDVFGVMMFPRWSMLTPDQRKRLVEMSIPMLAPGTRMDESAAWGDAARAVLAEESLALAQLRVPGLTSPSFIDAPRAWMMPVREFSLGPVAADECAAARSPLRWKREARFVLPRGSYATVVLRALGE